MSRELITIEEYKARKLETLKRIAEALEKLVKSQSPENEAIMWMNKGKELALKELEGEKSVENPVPLQLRGVPISKAEMDRIQPDSTPLPKPLPKVVQTGGIQWIIHEGRKYKACKFCDNLVSWNHDTDNYDHFSPAFKYLYPKCNTGGG